MPEKCLAQTWQNEGRTIKCLSHKHTRNVLKVLSADFAWGQARVLATRSGLKFNAQIKLVWRVCICFCSQTGLPIEMAFARVRVRGRMWLDMLRQSTIPAIWSQKQLYNYNVDLWLMKGPEIVSKVPHWLMLIYKPPLNKVSTVHKNNKYN